MPPQRYDYQYFTKGVQMPKRSPKIGCGRRRARTLFSGLSKLFRDLLIMSLDLLTYLSFAQRNGNLLQGE